MYSSLKKHQEDLIQVIAGLCSQLGFRPLSGKERPEDLLLHDLLQGKESMCCIGIK